MATAACKRSTTAGGVLAGDISPFHAMTSKPGMPASLKVGMSGEAVARASLGTASARRLPAFTCGSSAGMLSIMKSIWPATRSVMAGPLPL
ncbi:hypothetical protein D3C77_705710 [compost metagenome]